MLNISNSYDGTAALTTQAGLWYKDSRDDEISFTSKGSLGSIVVPAGNDKQKDVVTLVKTIADNIASIVVASRETTIEDDGVSSLLKKIEKAVGTRRKEILETILSEEDGTMTSWDIFESLSKFSAVEETSAAKRWFETLADSFLVISNEVRKTMK
jgi:kynureninase